MLVQVERFGTMWCSMWRRTSPRFTKCDHKALVEIFKKIGQKERTKQGLLELFSFKQKNPHVDLEPFMAQSSQ